MKVPALWRGLLPIVLLLSGCWRQTGPEVVVYTALDQEFSAPILDDFAKESKIEVLPKFDTESTKTVGLAQAIIAERARPRCDVFWNNEILLTLRLEKLGLVESYRPKLAAEYPAEFRSTDGAWHGFAARARVLIVNKQLPESERPTSILDLADPKWKGRAAIAKPLFGTTATHAACLVAAWGNARAEKFFTDVKENARVLSGNKQVALAVGAGDFAFGLTDTDDALSQIEQGQNVEIIYPDQGPDGFGALFIPNTLAILKDCPHPAEARKLVDYLLTPEVESRLAAGPGAQIPLHPAATPTDRVQGPSAVKAMQVDFTTAGEKWERAAKFLRDLFATAQ